MPGVADADLDVVSPTFTPGGGFAPTEDGYPASRTHRSPHAATEVGTEPQIEFERCASHETCEEEPMHKASSFGRTRMFGALCVALAAAAALPAAAFGFTTHPGDNGGNPYRWPGALVLSIDVDQWGGGWVRSTPYSIDCPWACVRAYDPGTTVVLSTSPTPGFRFEGWIAETGEGPCAEARPTASQCTITMTQDVNVRALYTRIPQQT
jgi:hypothetical protein